MSGRLLVVSPDYGAAPGGGAVIGEQLRESLNLESRHIHPGMPDETIKLVGEKALGRTILGTYLPLRRSSLAAVARMLETMRPTVMHANGFGHPLVDTIAGLAMRLNVPVVITVHGLLQMDGLTRRWAKALVYRYYSNRAALLDGALAVTCPMDAIAQDLSLLTTRAVEVIPWGIEPRKFDVPTKHDHPWPTLVAIGRASPRKRYDLLLRALPEVKRHFPNLSLTIVGGIGARGYARRMRRLRQDLGLDDTVRFTGSESRDAAQRILCTSDVYVSTSARETFGLATLEACSSGIPVVATAVAVATSIVHANRGRLLRPDAGADEVAANLLHVLRNHTAFKEKAETAAPLVREAYSWEKTVQRYRAVFGLPENGARVGHG